MEPALSGYQVLARRYRPQTFEDLVGQDVVVRTLRNALASGKIHHAYLFSGLRGVGKTSVARLLAKALNCVHGPTAEPCGQCPACTDIATGTCPDVQEIDAASTRGIDDIRELREVARVLPLRDRYRVFILDEAHQITPAAFNALLKILEEPPAHVVFVLASTDKQKFPATILSRCLQVDFRPIAADVVAARLEAVAHAEGFSLAAGAAQLIARAGEGSLRDALSLLDRVRAFAGGAVDEAAVAEVLGLPPFELLLALWRALAAGDVATTLDLLRQAEQSGRDPVSVFEQLVLLLHALLLLACDNAAVIPFPATCRAELATSATALGSPLLLRLLGLALEQRHLVNGSDHPGLAVAVAVGRLALWPRLQRVEAILASEPATLSAASSLATRARPEPAGGAALTARPHPRPEAPAATSQPSVAGPEPSPKDPRSRLVAAIEASGAHLLAGRIASATTVDVDGEVLIVRFAAITQAAMKSLADQRPKLIAAARRAELGTDVRLVTNHAAKGIDSDDLTRRVEGDDRVRAVLDIFGGRVERITEKP